MIFQTPKHTWKIETMESNCRKRNIPWFQWRKEKREALRDKTGFDWVDYHVAGYIQFVPKWSSLAEADPTLGSNRPLVERILMVTSHRALDPTPFDEIAESLDAPLDKVLALCKGLARAGCLVPVGGRDADSVVGFWVRKGLER